MNKKRTGISRLNLELLVSVALCLTAAAVFFFAARFLSENALQRYFDATSYVEKKTDETADDFQVFVTKNHISTSDSEIITAWLANRKLLNLCIAMNGAIVYDSSLYSGGGIVSDSTDEVVSSDETITPDQAITPDEVISPDDTYGDVYALDSLARWFQTRETVFSDGTAATYWLGAYDYLAYIYVGYALIFLSALLFIVLLTLLIRKKLAYIDQLEYEIHILEGGNLEHEISVQGKDELTSLARGLNTMRLSFIEQIEAEKNAQTANRELITALSHDLRTPLTTQMGYLEILKEQHCTTEEERQDYLEKCLSNCRQIKQMSDRLFEYFLAYSRGSEAETAELSPFDGLEIFSQIISEHSILLEEKGFRFRLSMPETPFTVRVNPDCLFRIFNNIFSNLEKYADPGEPVRIAVALSTGGCELHFVNRVRPSSPETESTRIGLESVRSLMALQNGSCTYGEENGAFRLTLSFPR